MAPRRSRPCGGKSAAAFTRSLNAGEGNFARRLRLVVFYNGLPPRNSVPKLRHIYYDSKMRHLGSGIIIVELFHVLSEDKMRVYLVVLEVTSDACKRLLISLDFYVQLTTCRALHRYDPFLTPLSLVFRSVRTKTCSSQLD